MGPRYTELTEGKVQWPRIYTLDRTVKYMGPRYTELTEGKVQRPRIYTFDSTVKFMFPDIQN